MVVIAIISILAGLLLPALSRARKAARRAGCLSNHKQMALGALMYASENDDRVPGNVPGGVNGADLASYWDSTYWWSTSDTHRYNWVHEIENVIASGWAVFACPNAESGLPASGYTGPERGVGYRMPFKNQLVPITAAAQPSRLILTLDAAKNGTAATSYPLANLTPWATNAACWPGVEAAYLAKQIVNTSRFDGHAEANRLAELDDIDLFRLQP